VIGLSVGLPALWLAWVGYLEARRSGNAVGELTMAEVADQLAVAIGAQWEAEAAIRRLNDPYPLPVSWDPADPSLTDSWDSLVKLASSGAGWPVPPPAAAWAAGPEGLTGTGGELVEVLARVPTGRLVVLGEPGAGKTMLMVRLVLDLLARRASGSPVPILASVASWNPAEQDLRHWLSAQLMIDHPALAGVPPTGREESSLATALLASGLILPILDGLDEIPEEVRGPAISRINDALRPGEPLVVTCRNRQYWEAVRPKDGAEVTLRGSTAVQLRPLDPATVRKYLCDDAGGPVARARWDPVLAVLGTEAPAGQALTTPLMVGLARTIYNPRPGELPEHLRDPAELCDQVDQAAVESLLFDAFIPAAYRHDHAGRWKAQDAEKWLVFLADHLDDNIGGPDLAWWQLGLAVPHAAAWFGGILGIAAGAGVGVMAAVMTASVAGPMAAAIAGVAATVLIGVTIRFFLAEELNKAALGPSRGFEWRPPSHRLVAMGIVAGAAGGVVVGLDHGVTAGVLLGFGIAAAVVLVGWTMDVRSAVADLSSAVTPTAVFARDRKVALVVGLATGLASWLAGGLLGLGAGLAGFTAGFWVGFAAGFGYAVLVGLLAASYLSAWPYYVIAQIRLTLRHRLPWRLMTFLADAHRHGVLRQAGAVYQFRHIELQHRLATRPSEPRQGLVTRTTSRTRNSYFSN
jgi:NACHT domain